MNLTESIYEPQPYQCSGCQKELGWTETSWFNGFMGGIYCDPCHKEKLKEEFGRRHWQECNVNYEEIWCRKCGNEIKPCAPLFKSELWNFCSRKCAKQFKERKRTVIRIDPSDELKITKEQVKRGFWHRNKYDWAMRKFLGG